MLQYFFLSQFIFLNFKENNSFFLSNLDNQKNLKNNKINILHIYKTSTKTLDNIDIKYNNKNYNSLKINISIKKF